MTETQDSPKPAKKRPLWKRILYALVLFVVLLIFGLVIAKNIWDSRFFRGYQADLPFQAEILSKEDVQGDWRESLSLQLLPGEKVPAVFHYPKDRPEKGVPCVVLLYGIGQKLKFLDDIARYYVRDGFAILGFEQLGQGERKTPGEEGPLDVVLRLRKRSGQTVVETRRIVDYLRTRPEVDSENLFLFGISMGAMMGTSALAMETRFKGGILMWGGGDLPRMVSQNRTAKIELKPYQRWLAARLASLFEPAEPLNWIHRISPRPLLFQNALHDEIVPKECTEAYYDKAGEPKEILWYDCGHENGLSEALVKKIIGDQIEWLHRQTGNRQ